MEQNNANQEPQQEAGYQRIRLLDKTGFTEPQEAYSLLLPEEWKCEYQVIWNPPGSVRAGTYKWIKATSPDGQYHFEIFPDLVYAWNTNPSLIQFNLSIGDITLMQPMDAEPYLRNVFARELGNIQIVNVQPNPFVTDQIRESSQQAMRELAQYGAGPTQIYPSAINADVRWADGSEGLIMLGVSVTETTTPNMYTGMYDKSYITFATNRILFRYPAAESKKAKDQFSTIMTSFRTNPLWNDAVNKFWKEARQQSHAVHIGKIKLIDDQTRKMGQATIATGAVRLKTMDTDMRPWEVGMAAQERMHINFVRLIRGV
jgi:hypothetical protein